MKPVTVRAKITLWFSALIAVISIMMFVLMLVISTSVLHRDVKEELINTVSANTEEIEFFTDFEMNEREAGDQYVMYNGGYLEIDDDYLDESDGVFTALYDSEGNLLYGQRIKNAPLNISSEIGTYRADGEKYYVYCTKLSGDGLDGLVLQGVVNENAKETTLTRITKLSLLLLPLLAVCAIVGGYILAGRLLRPIREIGAAAEKISGGDDLAARIEIGEGKDELHRLADTFNNMFERLERSFEAEKQFTSDISHELRTPVTAALAQSEFALEEDCSPEEYRKALEVIRRQCLRMKSILEEMLSFSRLERMEKLADAEKVDFSELAAFVCQEQALRKENGITLKSDIESGVFVNGSYGLLTSLLENLISNAYRYGKENGSINVSLKSDGKTAFLSVADDGIGVPAEIQDKIFLRFYRADQARTSGDSRYGVGLGLPMAKQIAKLHSGSLSLESEEGKGSTFTLSVPLAESQDN